MHLTFARWLSANTKKGGICMEKYIGIGFVILCLSVLAGIVGILQYQLHIDINKEKVDISPANAYINQSNNSTNE